MQTDVMEQEFVHPGHVGCPGCGATNAMRFVLKALGEKTIMVLPACCWSVIAGPYPHSALKIPVIHAAFETGGATATGVRAALDMKGDTETTVLTWAGDGGTFDIGIQALSGAAERGTKFIYICYDNEGYMNTGVQRSSTTPAGARTATTPVGPMRRGKPTRRKNLALLMAMHWIPYAATATLSHLEDFAEKLIKAKQKKEEGLSFIHIFCPCPTGWGVPSDIAIELCRAAVRTNYFPLWEAENGIVRITHEVKKPRPVSEYLNLVKKFSHMTPEEQQVVQDGIDFDYAFLTHLAKFKR